jgi:hypothetical protein
MYVVPVVKNFYLQCMWLINGAGVLEANYFGDNSCSNSHWCKI